MDSNQFVFFAFVEPSKFSPNVDPVDPFFITELLKIYKKTSQIVFGNAFKHINNRKLGFSTYEKFRKRRAPENDEDPFKAFLEILDVGSISTRRHEWSFGNMLPISTRKMKLNFGNMGLVSSNKVLTVNVGMSKK